MLAARQAGTGTIIVTGLGADRAKLELAKRFGASHTIDVQREDDPRRADAHARLRALEHGESIHSVLVPPS